MRRVMDKIDPPAIGFIKCGARPSASRLSKELVWPVASPGGACGATFPLIVPCGAQIICGTANNHPPPFQCSFVLRRLRRRSMSIFLLGLAGSAG
eukprot:gene22101-biopygen13249